ncbi:Group XV phospholipase A2, partial [Stegodyphus mimosarum]
MSSSYNCSILSAGVVFLALLRLSVAAYHSQERQDDRLSPVILVPGDGGSQLEAKLDKPEIVHYFCNRKT